MDRLWQRNRSIQGERANFDSKKLSKAADDPKIIRFHEMKEDHHQKGERIDEKAFVRRARMVLRFFDIAFKLENLPFAILTILAALSLLSRLWLLKH